MPFVRIDAVATHARFRPDAPACADLESGRRWTYAELDRDVNRVAAWLVARLGPASGARIATIARNTADLLILHLAAARSGAIYVPLNWRLAPAEIAVLVSNAAPKLLFHGADFAATAAAAAGRRCPTHDLGAAGSGLAALTRKAPAAPPPEARRPWDAPATLLYTSGTSGRPKGVILSERNAFFSATNFIHGNGVTPYSVFLCDMPMFHTAGLFAAVRAPLLAGASVLISPGFDPVLTLARLTDPALGVTHYFSVPQMAQLLWDQPGFDPAALRGLAVWATGGAPNPPAQIARFARAGIPMLDGFGMSETGSNFGMPGGDPELLVAKAGSCGLPYLSVAARIVDDDGRDLPDGETGELWLAGPSVTSGYWNQPEENARAFAGGWFRTGDAVRRDRDGFHYLVDRRKDMFISGGENVYPAEIEAALAELDDVAEAAVIGVPDPKWGEVGRAYLVARAGAAIDVETVRAHLAVRLARFKAPAGIVIIDAIPRTASGKALKHELKARAAEELAATAEE